MTRRGYWRKLGVVFCPNHQHDWMVSHAANPVAEHHQDDVVRFYFGCRDEQKRSSIGYVDVDLRLPTEVIGVADEPVVAPGEIGTFDDSGTSMGCLVRLGDKRLLYYVGWNLGVTVPWRNSIGLAVSEGPKERFRKVSRAPIMDRGDHDPFSLSYPWVMLDHGIWRMWYGSNLSWGKGKEEMIHVIRYAESNDGIHWQRSDQIAVDVRGDEEYAVSRPCVVEDNGVYRMWYSYRGAAYRIGYAESADGVNWKRLDQRAGIEPSGSGWDSDSVEYPCVFEHAGQTYMAYNGNGYGESGLGLAVLDG